jgi:mRNA interferase RelE/StbE
MDCRTIIEWTDTAKELLFELPKNDARGLVAKISALRGSDARKAGKPLIGPFQGYRRVTYGRYRAIFRVTEDTLASGDVLVTIRVYVVAVGIRKERDKKDVYRVAQRLLELGLLKVHPIDDDDRAAERN